MQKYPIWLERLMRRFGFVPRYRVPEPGITMVPDPPCAPGEPVRPAVEILDVDEVRVLYRLPDGRIFSRSGRGFMKNYSRK